mmetsp:Transcript_14533/g.48154  ORF Transcript_14533/g.48154 Transcript_14533/m.48154 type:complete len:216 (+) Transcript_14533:622-1269(+)
MRPRPAGHRGERAGSFWDSRFTGRTVVMRCARSGNAVRRERKVRVAISLRQVRDKRGARFGKRRCRGWRRFIYGRCWVSRDEQVRGDFLGTQYLTCTTCGHGRWRRRRRRARCDWPLGGRAGRFGTRESDARGLHPPGGSECRGARHFRRKTSSFRVTRSRDDCRELHPPCSPILYRRGGLVNEDGCQLTRVWVWNQESSWDHRRWCSSTRVRCW